MSDAHNATVDFSALCAHLKNDNLVAAIKCSISLSKQSYKSLASSPLVALYTLQLHSANKAVSPAKLLNQRLVLLHHLCKLNLYSSLASVHIGAGLSLVCALKQIQSPKRSAVLRRLMQQLTLQRLTIAVDIVKIAKLLLLTNSSDYFSQLRLAQWQWYALWSTQLVTGATKQPWSERVNKVIQRSPHWTTLSVGKLHVSPSNVLPGKVIQLKGKTVITLGDNGDRVQVTDGEHAFDLNPATNLNNGGEYVSQQQFEQAIRRLPEQSIHPATFSIERPPKSLLRVLNELNKKDIDITKLTFAVEHDANFSNFVQQAATQSNRQNIQVRSVKQAVMTYGTERLGDMMVTHALYQRLCQQDFPAKSDIMDHVDLVMALASELAYESDIMLPQTASLLALLCHSALFTSPQLKTLRSWKIRVNTDGVSMADISPDHTLSLLKISATRIATSWRIQNRIVALLGTILSETPRTNRESELIKLAVFWAIKSKQGQLSYTQNNTIENTMMSKLALTQRNKLNCLEASSCKTKCTLVKH